MQNKKQSFVQGAATLAATVAVVKIIGAIYKIPLYNILGDEGTSYFGVAYNIYSLLFSLSTAGLPVALSRMVASANALGKQNQVKRIFRVSLGAFTVFGLISTLIMLIWPRQLAAAFDNVEAMQSIAALAPSIVLVCIMSAYRGYTQGISNMVPTSVSQIIEVMCKLVFGLFLAWYFNGRYGLQMASAGAMLGVTIGEFFALIYSWLYKVKMEKARTDTSPMPDVPDKRGNILLNLIKIGIPIALCSTIINVLALVDSKLIMQRLQFAAGYSYNDAKALYGVFIKAQTLFNLPSAFAVPLTISALPAISSFLAQGETLKARGISEGAIKLTNLIGMPAGIGMSVLALPIMNVLYWNSNAAGAPVLQWLGVAGFFVCLMLTTNSILQAYGHEKFTIITIIIGGLVKIGLNWFLLGDASIGVVGAAIASLACYVVICILNLVFICVKIPEHPRMTRLFVKPFIASAVMGVAAWLSYLGASKLAGIIGIDTTGRLGICLCMCAAIVIAVIVYAVMLLVIKTITADDIALLPKGEKIAKILRIKI